VLTDQRLQLLLQLVRRLCTTAADVPQAPQLLSNTACALSRLELNDETLFAAISSASLPLLGEFAPQELAGLAWSIAKSSMMLPLMNAISAAALPTCSYFSPMDLAVTAWSLSKCDIVDCPSLESARPGVQHCITEAGA